MQGVLTAERTILVEFKTIRCVLLVLHCVVVPLLAFIASECNFYAHLGTSNSIASLYNFADLGKNLHSKITHLPTGEISIPHEKGKVNKKV